MTSPQQRQPPGLFDSVPPAFVNRRCGKCHRRKGQRVCRPRCIKCGAMLAEPGQWLWAAAWCEANVGLIRQSVCKARPDLAGVLTDTAELVSLSLVSVVRSLLGYDASRGTKFSTFAANGLRFTALKLPSSGPPTVAVADWNRVAG